MGRRLSSDGVRSLGADRSLLGEGNFEGLGMVSERSNHKLMKAEVIKTQHHLPPCTEFLPFAPVLSCPCPRACLRYAPQSLPEKGRALLTRNQLGRRVQRARSAAWIHSAPFSLLKLAAKIAPEIGTIIPVFGMTGSLIFRQQA